MAALCRDLQNPTPGTAVLLMDFNRDSMGRIYTDGEIACIVSAWSPVPVYGISDTFIGYGVVGGVVSDTADEAEYAARMGAEILNGTPVGDIPVSGPPEAQAVVDYVEVQRHAIPFSLLPEGIQVVNKPIEGIVLPAWAIVAIFGTAGSLAVVIAVLALTNRRITKARHDLDTSNQKLHTLFSITRHDVNNQVMAASGFLELVSEDITDSGIQPFISNIRKSLKNIEHQIAFARDYEKAGASDPVWQDPHDIAKHAASYQDGVSVDVSIPGIEIYADPMLEKVFANLYENAAHHGENATRVRVTSDIAGGAWLIVVEDNGVGVPDEKKQLIFERGYGANTGYGLFLAASILAITGLTIVEAGTYGAGARFEITVPKGRWGNVRRDKKI